MKGAQPCRSPVCASKRFLNKCALRKSNLVFFISFPNFTIREKEKVLHAVGF